MATTDSVAAQLKRRLLDVKGVSEVNISRSDYQPEYQVDFDREKLALHGLNLATAWHLSAVIVSMVLLPLNIVKMVMSMILKYVMPLSIVPVLKVWKMFWYITLKERLFV